MLKKLVIGFASVLAMLGSFNNVLGAPLNGGFGQPDSTSAVGVAGTGVAQGEGLINSIKVFTNWVLGLLGLIALLVLLWGGFQMVTAAGDDGKYKKGFTILKQAAIGLIFIGISWFIVSILFFIVGGVTETGGTQ